MRIHPTLCIPTLGIGSRSAGFAHGHHKSPLDLPRRGGDEGVWTSRITGRAVGAFPGRRSNGAPRGESRAISQDGAGSRTGLDNV
jgi:hypothetical protein